MGNSPTTDSTSTDDDQDEPSIHPDQSTLEPPEEDTTTEDGSEATAGAAAGAATGGAGGAGGTTAGTSPTTRDPDPSETEADEQDEGDSERRDERLIEQDSDTETSEQENDSDDEEKDDTEAQFTVHTGPWETIGWGNEPELRDLEATYPEALEIEYEVLPPRAVDTVDRDHNMPVSRDIVLPEDTETSYRALCAADEQGKLRPFLRRLRIAALSEARDIEDVDVLLELAGETGLDTEQLQDDMDTVEIPEDADTTPRITGHIAGEPHRWSGRVNANRLQLRFTGEGIYSEPTTLGLGELVGRHEPISTAELRAAYDEVPTEADAIMRVDFGGDEYWKTR